MLASLNFHTCGLVASDRAKGEHLELFQNLLKVSKLFKAKSREMLKCWASKMTKQFVNESVYCWRRTFKQCPGCPALSPDISFIECTKPFKFLKCWHLFEYLKKKQKKPKHMSQTHTSSSHERWNILRTTAKILTETSTL